MWNIGASKRPAVSSGHKWETVEAIKDLAEIYGITTYELSGMANKMELKTPGQTYAKYLIEEYSCNFSLHAEFFTAVMCNESRSYDTYSMENSLNYAKMFNCPVVVHPGGTLTNSETQLQHVINNLAQAISNTGIDPSFIYIETMGKTDQFGTFEQCIKIAQALGTRICVDWAHIYSRYMATYGYFNNQMVKDILEVMEILPGNNECYFHISGMQWNYRGEVKHLPLVPYVGDKVLNSFPWRMVCQEIKNSNLSGRMIVECDGEFCRGVRQIKKFMEE